MTSYDLAIVGGGIGGSALAKVMARAGYSVLLLEQSEAYVDRVRGELVYCFRSGREARFRLVRGAEAAGVAGTLGGVGLLRVDTAPVGFSP